MQQTGGLSGLSGRNGIRKGGYGGVVTASCCRFHACPARSSLADLTLPLAQVPEHTGHQAMQWKGSETLSWQSGLGPGCVVFGEALPLPKPWVLHLQNGRVGGGGEDPVFTCQDCPAVAPQTSVWVGLCSLRRVWEGFIPRVWEGFYPL